MTADVKHNIKDKEQTESVPLLCSKRWTLAYCGVFGFFFIYALRVNLSVGIVCMVNDTKKESANQTEDETCMSNTNVNATSHEGEFNWDKSQTSLLLSSFFYGYITTQVLGGWLSGRFGGKRVLGIGVGITAICNLLVPVAARWDYRPVLALRIIMGIAEGAAFPSMHSLWGRWAPPLERTKLSSFTYAGQNLGNIVTYILSGWLCVHGFDGGWPSIFYVTGGGCLVWVIIWFIVVSDSPEDHPTISKSERDYIVTTRGKLQANKDFKVPWLAVLKTRAIWVCLTAHVCNNWMHYTLLTGLPTFMKEALKFDIDQNGLLSAVPYMVMVCTSISAGQLADFLRKKYLSTTFTRRLFQAIGFLGGGSCIVGVGFIGCEHRNAAVALLAIAVGFEGLCYAGYMVNHVDFAPRYAGVLYGMTNMVATVPGIVAPLVVGALTPNKTQEEWKRVFYICGAFTLVGTIVFGGFAVGELEPWAKMAPDMEEEIPPPNSEEYKEKGHHDEEVKKKTNDNGHINSAMVFSTLELSQDE
ncbi:sialin-like isoform X1 [Biomphalaria pfeifferi]|uniref:Sialin n=1 Tax=Biomphalaria pfeifferi TaxID=112525 RepID=A0AAD8BVA1_BIOPF|nr:sialin-like isoform X1 [Biomphalaria pfeifferi]